MEGKMRKLAFILIFFVMIPFFSFAEGQADGPAIKPTISVIKATMDTTFIKPEDRQDAVCAEFKKLTGITLQVIQPVHAQYEEKLQIMISSGEIPDIFETNPTKATLYARDGAIVALDSFIAAHPSMKSINPEIIEAYRMKDGKIYFFPYQLGGGCVGYVRKDWLDKLGLQIPTTYDELVNVFEAFTKNDPDGNGKADTFGYSITLMGDGQFQDMYNRLIMLDARGIFIKKAGVWVDGFAQPEMRAAMGRWQDLYKRGVIDTEIFTNNTSMMREKFFQGRVGLFEYWSGSWGFKIQRDTKIGSGDQAVVVPMAPIKGARYLNRLAPVLCISSKAKDPKAVFDNFIGLMYDSGRGQNLFTYGVEGIHWKRSPDGMMQMLPVPSNPKIVWAKTYIEPVFRLNNMKISVPLDRETLTSVEIWRANSDTMPLEDGDVVFNRNIGQLHTLRLEIFSKITKGELSVDAGLKQYMDRSKNLNVETMIKELNG